MINNLNNRKRRARVLLPATQGTLSDSQLDDLCSPEHSVIKNHPDPANPNSADLIVEDLPIRLPAACLPRKGESISAMIREMGGRQLREDEPMAIDQPYAIKLYESIDLSKNRQLFGSSSAKSSTGRTDMHARTMCDGVPFYDTVPRAYRGDLWMLATQKSFQSIVSPGQSFIQMRFMNADARLSAETLVMLGCTKLLLHDGEKFITNQNDMTERVDWEDRTITLTLGSASLEIIGYIAKKNPKVILDYRNEDAHDPTDFFEPIYAPKSGKIRLKKNRFYLLITNEAVSVPQGYACTMQAVKIRHSERRAHYAGFIDEGWGTLSYFMENGVLVPSKGRGRRLVLEVRSFEDHDIYVGQPIASIGYERVPVPALRHYDQRLSSHYLTQGTSIANPLSILSKHFKKSA